MITIDKFSLLSNFEFKLDHEERRMDEVSQIVPRKCFASENNFTLYISGSQTFLPSGPLKMFQCS